MTDQQFNQKIKKLGALAFLPSSKVESTFVSMKDELPLHAINFINYSEATFIRGRLCEPFAAVEKKSFVLQNIR